MTEPHKVPLAHRLVFWLSVSAWGNAAIGIALSQAFLSDTVTPLQIMSARTFWSVNSIIVGWFIAIVAFVSSLVILSFSSKSRFVFGALAVSVAYLLPSVILDAYKAFFP